MATSSPGVFPYQDLHGTGGTLGKSYLDQHHPGEDGIELGTEKVPQLVQ